MDLWTRHFSLLRFTTTEYSCKSLGNIRIYLLTLLTQDNGQSPAAVLGPNGVMYLEGRVVSGPLDSLVKLLLPLSTTTIPPKRLADELDEVIMGFIYFLWDLKHIFQRTPKNGSFD